MLKHTQQRIELQKERIKELKRQQAIIRRDCFILRNVIAIQKSILKGVCNG